MRYCADLHIHSRYARACSRALRISTLDAWSRLKGVQILATGDFTHPHWRAELKAELEPAVEQGLFVVHAKKSLAELEVGGTKISLVDRPPVRFILGTEIASIYKEHDKLRRVHNLIFFPSFESVDRFVAALEKRGCNLRADGRPIVGLSSRALLQIVLDTDERGVLIPAHAWTPHFAVFGSKSGYDSLVECFGDLAPHIFAIETGLSSDPLMNWQVSALDRVALISNSDAHSLPNLAREATLFSGSEISYDLIMGAIRQGNPLARAAGKHKTLPLELTGTIEFYPHEGRYHYDGHRDCGVVLHPTAANKQKKLCPKCKRSLIVGVLSRVEALADRAAGFRPPAAPEFKRTIELDKIIADAVGVKSRTSPKVQAIFGRLLQTFGSELTVLLDTDYAALKQFNYRLAEAIKRVREERIAIQPGYDGVYGVIEIFSAAEKKQEKEQRTLL